MSERGTVTPEEREVAARPGRLPWRETLASMRYRDFRLLWTTSFFSSASRAVQQITLGWLVFDLTGSTLLLGTVQFLYLIPSLVLSPFLGVLIDQLDRRKVLIASQFILAFGAVLLAVGVRQEVVTTWHVFVFAVVSGIDNTVIHVVRQALLPRTVPKAALMNAMSLNSTSMNVTRVGAPFLGGVLIVALGVEGNFVLQAALLLCVAAAAFPMRVPPPADTDGSPVEPFTARLGAGLRHITGDRLLRSLFLFQFAFMFLAAPYASVLPAFAEDVLAVDARGLGALYAATGVGALLGALGLAALGNVRRKGLVALLMSIAAGAGLAAFGQTTSFPIAVALLLWFGTVQTLVSTVSMTIVQASTPDRLQGRVMSVYNLGHGTQALGILLLGAAGDIWGISPALTGMGVALALGALVALAGLPSVRDIGGRARTSTA